MGTVDLVSYMTQALYLVLWLSLPPIAVAAIVGTLFSLLQALTQIQEQTLIYVPKILATFGALMLFLPFMGDALAGYMGRIAVRIATGE